MELEPKKVKTVTMEEMFSNPYLAVKRMSSLWRKQKEAEAVELLMKFSDNIKIISYSFIKELSENSKNLTEETIINIAKKNKYVIDYEE